METGEGIRKAMKKSGIKREELFITTKVSEVKNNAEINSFGVINMHLKMFGRHVKSRFLNSALNIWIFTLFTNQCPFKSKVDAHFTMPMRTVSFTKTFQLKIPGR